MKWEVQVRRYRREIEVASSHRSLAAACRRLNSLISGRKHAIKDMSSAFIVNKETGEAFPLRSAQKLVKEGGE